MSLHDQKHGIIDTNNHTAGSQASVNEVNLIGTNNAPALVEVVLEAPGAASTTSKVVRRAADGHIAVPISGQAANEVLSKSQIEAMLTAGIYKESVHSVVANHAAATVGDGASGGPALVVGDIVINTTDKKLYTVTVGTGTGAAVTWNAGVAPASAQVRLNELTDSEWVYDAEGNVWIDRGSSSHSRQHLMTAVADHAAGNHKMFYSNASGQVIELGLGAAGAPLLGAGISTAPLFGSLLIHSAVVTAAGSSPVDTDLSSVPNDTIGIVKGSTGLVWAFFKNSADVYYVQLTAI